MTFETYKLCRPISNGGTSFFTEYLEKSAKPQDEPQVASMITLGNAV